MRKLDHKTKAALKRFLETHKAVKQQSKLLIQETPAVKEKRKNKLLEDYKEFVEYYFYPHLVKKKNTTAQFQIDAVNNVLKNKDYLHVAQWARGHAKSITFGTFLPIFLMLRNEMHYMIYVGANLSTATELLSATRIELQHNIRLINDYGRFFKRANVQDGEFVTSNNVKFKALGIGQSPRGSRHGGERPDYVVLDDVDTDERCRNEDRVKDAYTWVKSALLGTSGVSGRMLVCGNKISLNSVIHLLENDKAFSTSVVNALDDKGNVTWHQVYSQKVMENKIKRAGTRAANTEYFNRPTKEGKIFKESWLHFEDIRDEQFDYKVAYLDPSRGNSEFADYKAIVTVGFKNHRYYILDIFCRKTTMRTVGHYFFDIIKRFGDDTYLVSETIFGQTSHFRDFEDVYKEVGEELCVLQDKNPKKDKISRVQNLDALFETNKIFINKDIVKTDDYTQFEFQLLSFPTKGVHDDAPDALEGAISYLKRKIKNTKIDFVGEHDEINYF